MIPRSGAALRTYRVVSHAHHSIRAPSDVHEIRIPLVDLNGLVVDDQGVRAARRRVRGRSAGTGFAGRNHVGHRDLVSSAAPQNRKRQAVSPTTPHTLGTATAEHCRERATDSPTTSNDTAARKTGSPKPPLTHKVFLVFSVPYFAALDCGWLLCSFLAKERNITPLFMLALTRTHVGGRYYGATRPRGRAHATTSLTSHHICPYAYLLLVQ